VFSVEFEAQYRDELRFSRCVSPAWKVISKIVFEKIYISPLCSDSLVKIFALLEMDSINLSCVIGQVTSFFVWSAE